MNHTDDDPELDRAPAAPRSQRAATGLSTELQLCCAKLRAEGFDVVNADVLHDQDVELERYRVAEAAGGSRVAIADLEDDVAKARELAGMLTIYVQRATRPLGEKVRDRLLVDLDAELEYRGLRRPVEPFVALEEATGDLFTIAAKLRRLEELERLIGTVLAVAPDDWKGLASTVVELGNAYHWASK